MKSAFFQLQPNHDQLAIRIGAYFAARTRTVNHRVVASTSAVETMIQRAGLGRFYTGRDGELRRAVELAFTKLSDLGVVSRWDYADEVPTNGAEFLAAGLRILWPSP